MNPTNACTCYECVNCCKQRPGWFRPGEAEEAAALLGLTLPQLFAQSLAVDAWLADEDVHLLAPALAGHRAGTEYPYNPIGRCVFLTKEDRCQIHTAKPFECATARHDTGRAEQTAARMQTVELWRAHQAQIVELLGREPIMPEGDLGDLCGLMFGGLDDLGRGGL